MCGELFTRSTAAAHAEVDCYPSVELSVVYTINGGNMSLRLIAGSARSSVDYTRYSDTRPLSASTHIPGVQTSVYNLRLTRKPFDQYRRPGFSFAN